MSLFPEREDAFEKEFAHDEELRFKATARRNKLLGLWIAERLGKTGPEAEAYARSVIQAEFQGSGSADVRRKIRQDLENAGKTMDEAELDAKLQQLMARAVQEIKAGQ
jgi:hypothetical protein